MRAYNEVKGGMNMKTDMILEEDIFPFLPEKWGQVIREEDALREERISEIRLRVGEPIRLRYGVAEVAVSHERITAQCLERVISSCCHHSRYAMESELKNGYITIRGGHRIGMAGQAVITRGEIKMLKHIHSLVIRIAREVIGSADSILPYVWKDGRVQNTLIVAPPYSGKTTILRDLVRQLSDGDESCGRCGVVVGVADERSEIAGAYQGIPRLNVGARTEVIDGAPKASAMMMLIRAMSPAVIVTDELGRREDITAVEEAVHAGIAVMATLHGRDIEDVLARMNKTERELLALFSCIIFLDNKPRMGTVRKVISRDDIRECAI